MNPDGSSLLSEQQVNSNYSALLERVANASRRANRRVEEVKIIGVTKYVDAATTQFLVNAGCRDLGESRPQSLWEKAEIVAGSNLRWHLIGHLQRNKAKRTIPIVTTIHSLDSARLLGQIESDVGERETPLQILLEVNVTREENKTGISIQDAEQLLDTWALRPIRPKNLDLVGLMGMGSLTGSPDQTRQEFSQLRELRDRWRVRFGLPLPELSIGMSDDFEIAIEEGSTMIRVGSVLFTSSAAE